MKKYIIMIMATISSIHATEQEPWQSYNAAEDNTVLTIAPYLLTQSDEFDVAETSALMTIRSDDYLMNTSPHNNSMHTADDAFIPIKHEQREVLSYTFYPSFIPQATLVYHDYTTAFSSSSTIAKAVEKVQERHKKTGKRGMKGKKLSCSYCRWGTDNENSMEEHTFTNKHRDNAGLPRTLWYEEKYRCEICRIGFYRERGIKMHNKCETHLKKLVELISHCPSF